MAKQMIAIVGPTASGKTDLALRIAQQFNGEIICADSRTIYRGMDIGTAKPSMPERHLVPHHILDVVHPNETYSAAQFKEAVGTVLDGMKSYKQPLLVGGTGLYLWSYLYDYQFPGGASRAKRDELEALELDELVGRLEAADPERASTVDLQNKRRVVRALELAGQPRIAPKALPAGTVIIGLNPGMDKLGRRIARRTKLMLEGGLIEEVERLIDRYNPVLEAFNTVGYRETVEFITGSIDRTQLEDHINLHTRQLAKRQLTWFKRNPDVNWFEDSDSAYKYAAKLLAGAL